MKRDPCRSKNGSMRTLYVKEGKFVLGTCTVSTLLAINPSQTLSAPRVRQMQHIAKLRWDKTERRISITIMEYLRIVERPSSGSSILHVRPGLIESRHL